MKNITLEEWSKWECPCWLVSTFFFCRQIDTENLFLNKRQLGKHEIRVSNQAEWLEWLVKRINEREAVGCIHLWYRKVPSLQTGDKYPLVFIVHHGTLRFFHLMWQNNLLRNSFVLFLLLCRKIWINETTFLSPPWGGPAGCWGPRAELRDFRIELDCGFVVW